MTLLPGKELMLGSIRPFTGPAYRANIFKLEPPGPIHCVPNPHGPETAVLQDAYDGMTTMLPRPAQRHSANVITPCWLLLSRPRTRLPWGSVRAPQW